MKKTYIILGFLFLSAIICAQNKDTKKADQLFESYQYAGSIEAYLKLVEGNTIDHHVYQNLADSYYQIFNMEEAAKWYEKVIQETSNPENHYRYAQCLRSLGKYDEANTQMDKFANLLPHDERSKTHKANPNYVKSLLSAKPLFKIENTAFSVEKSNDFAPYLSNSNDLYFVSTRNSSKIDKWSNQPYLDVFKATRNENGTFSEVVEVKELNTPFHDGPVAISEDGNTMFFARDGHSLKLYEKDKKNKVKVGQLGIYKAIKSDDKWLVIESLPINSTSYSVGHPTLSEDGKTLYFTSNMPGGFGESDIWKISVSENGYGTPKNLGNKINTPGREAFPFITSDGILYFASSGHQGFGGLDIFKVDLKNTDKILNIGNPINTEKDDFSLSFNSKKNIGFFASNRSGKDVIYQAIPVCEIEALAIITNKNTEKVLQNATLNLYDADKNLISSLNSDSLGKVTFGMECSNEYFIQVTAANYQTLTIPVEKTGKNTLTIPLALIPNEVIITDKEVILGNVYFEFNKSNITSVGAEELNKLVKVMHENPSMVIFVKSHTDTKGSISYNLKLSEQRAQSTVKYIISKGISKDRISGKGFGSSEPKVNCGANCTEEQNATNRRSEFIIIKK